MLSAVSVALFIVSWGAVLNELTVFAYSSNRENLYFRNVCQGGTQV